MKKVIIIGASGSLATYVVQELKRINDISLTLFVRNVKRLKPKIAENCDVIVGDAMDYSSVKSAIAGHDIVYINLAGNLEEMTKNIVKAMHETGVKRVIAISSIWIYNEPVRAMLIPYRKLADVIESSGLDYTILRPGFFTKIDEVDYILTRKGEPEKDTAISRKSIASFISTIVDDPGLHSKENLGISKPANV